MLTWRVIYGPTLRTEDNVLSSVPLRARDGVKYSMNSDGLVEDRAEMTKTVRTILITRQQIFDCNGFIPLHSPVCLSAIFRLPSCSTSDCPTRAESPFREVTQVTPSPTRGQKDCGLLRIPWASKHFRRMGINTSTLSFSMKSFPVEMTSAHSLTPEDITGLG